MGGKRALAVLISLGCLASPALSADPPSLRPSITSVDPFGYSFYIHAGPAGLWLSEGATMTAGGFPVPGGDISIRPKPQMTFALEAGYFITPNIAVSFTGGFPPSVKINGAGALAPLGQLGGATYGPMTLTAHYHFTGLGAFQPYIGAGPTFMYVFKTSDGALANLKISNAVGFAVQVGFDYMIDKNWGVFFDVKKAYLRTKATGTLGGAAVNAKVKLDPLVVHTGVTYRF